MIMICLILSRHIVVSSFFFLFFFIQTHTLILIYLFILAVNNEKSARSSRSCVHNDSVILNICSDFTRWCKVVPDMTMTFVGDCAFSGPIYIHVFSSASAACFWTSLSENCGCVSYQVFSPVIHIYVEHRLSPLQLLSSRGMTQFLFIIIMHSLPAWIDYTQATLCPQFNFLPGGV